MTFSPQAEQKIEGEREGKGGREAAAKMQEIGERAQTETGWHPEALSHCLSLISSFPLSLSKSLFLPLIMGRPSVTQSALCVCVCVVSSTGDACMYVCVVIITGDVCVCMCVL